MSRACREWLKAILSICHRLVMTNEIRDQWKKHASLFTSEWRASMVARKKIVWVGPDSLDDSIAERITSAGLTVPDQKAVMKDLCLLKAALATDGIIITRDEHLCQIVEKHPRLREMVKDLTWINPEKHGTDTLPKGARS